MRSSRTERRPAWILWAIVDPGSAAARGQPHAVRVVLLDDAPADRALIAAALGDGVMVVGAHGTLASLLRALRDGVVPDLVVADLNLPDSTGTDTVRELRAAHPTLPIVAVTGDDDAAELAILSGADDVVAKDQLDRDLRRAVINSRERSISGTRTATRAFHLADMPLVVVDRAGEVVLANRETALLLERPPEPGRAFTTLFVQEDRLEVAGFLDSAEALDGARAWTSARLQLPAGRTREVALIGRFDGDAGRLHIRLADAT